MRTIFPRLASMLESRRSIVILLLVVGVCSALQAFTRPLWADEINTAWVASLPGASAIWKALENSVDIQPPTYFYISRLSSKLVPDDHLGLRLPSILGLLLALVCVFAILSARADRLSALVGVTFILCTVATYYVAEARPYCLLLGFEAAAIFAWQRIGESNWNCLLLALALAAAQASHHYALFVLPVFGVAELLVWLYYRTFRIATWAAIFAGVIPFLLFQGLLLRQREYYGSHFWAKPSLGLFLGVHSWLFKFADYWGLIFAIALTIGILYSIRTKSGIPEREAGKTWYPVAECGLIVMLLWLPVVAIVVARLAHGGMTERYMMPTILGAALAIGYLTNKIPSGAKTVLVLLMLMNYALLWFFEVSGALKHSLFVHRSAPAKRAKAILEEGSRLGLPVVFSSGQEYAIMAYYYKPTDTDQPFYFLSDTQAALKFVDSDSVDLTLLALQRYHPLHVVDYRDFASKHQEFLLVSNGDLWDWWPARLGHDGETLQLLSTDGSERIFKVHLKSGTSLSQQ